jgi:hypothetical protein
MSDHYPGAANCCCPTCRPHLAGRPGLPWPPADESFNLSTTNKLILADNVIPFPRPGQNLSDVQRRANVEANKRAAGDRPQALAPPYSGGDQYRERAPVGFGSARFDSPFAR